MKNKILGIAVAPVYVPLFLLAVHGADGKPTRSEKKRAKRIEKIQAARYNR